MKAERRSQCNIIYAVRMHISLKKIQGIPQNIPTIYRD